ncbi:MAG: hypothetical protein ACRDUV_19330 [Pseudonocardiaceae bacterium]
MSTGGMAQDHLAAARVNSHPVAVHQAHRVAGYDHGPTLVTVTTPVALTLGEVAAVLFDWTASGTTYEDLADDDHVRSLVTEAVVNLGCHAVEMAWLAAFEASETALLAYCQQRAAAVFGAEATR